jgi:hypothetical protein
MERKIRLLRQVVKFYSIYHVSENKHKQELLDFIDDIEKQLTLTDVVKSFYCLGDPKFGGIKRCDKQCKGCELRK